jgi:hypothetical protein
MTQTLASLYLIAGGLVALTTISSPYFGIMARELSRRHRGFAIMAVVFSAILMWIAWPYFVWKSVRNAR